MAESTTKIFTVTGDAASAIGGTRKRKRRSTANETMKIGKEAQVGGTSPGTSLQVEANKAPGSPDFVPSNFQKSTDTALAKTTTDSSPAPVKQGGARVEAPKTTTVNKPAPLAQEGGAKDTVKVILEKKKKGTKVVLALSKAKKVTLTPAIKTRKVAKKIRMSLGNFGKRVTRANTIKHESKKQNIEDIKKKLVEARLIKADSKAPEQVLRQMYADYMTLKNRAL